jgi:hypothetical protein
MGALLPTLTPDLVVTTFANAGNKTVPPQTDPNGFVNYHDGYGPDYEIDLTSGNTSAKGVERPVQNYLFAEMTSMMQWWQSMGLAPWYSNMANQGTNGYNAGSLVGRVNATSGEWVIWRSLNDANTVDPNTNGQTAWDYVPTTADLSTMFAMPAGGQGQKLLPGGITTEQVLAAKDFNTLVTGTFEYVTDAIATGSSNTPSNYAGLVECKLWTNSGVTFGVQRYLDRTGAIWTRGMQNGTWTSWATFAVTRAAVIAALGYTPANQATTITGGAGLSGGGDLSANRTISLAAIAQSTVLANPTASSAVPVGCTLLNGIILNSPANTLGLGTITPVNVASQGYVSGTTATFTGAGSFNGITNSGNETITGTLSVGNVTSVTTSGSASSLVITDTGSSGANIKLAGNGSTTPNKTIRAAGGQLQFVNSAYNSVMAYWDDAGNYNGASAGFSGTVTISTAGTGGVQINSSSTNSASINIANSGGGHSWAIAATGSAGPVAAGCLVFYDNTSGGTRGYFDTNGAFTVITSAQTMTLNVQDTGGNGANIKLSGNGSTTPNKFIRATNGQLQFVNHAYSSVIASLDDSGNLTCNNLSCQNLSCSYVFANNHLSSYTSQGSYVGWNQTSGGGETDFICNQGGGSVGGFNWYTTSGSGSTLTQVMSLTGSGNLSVVGTGNFNTSDKTVKTNFIEMSPVSIHDCWFGSYDRTDIKAHGTGVIAQDIRFKMPHHVAYNEFEVEGKKKKYLQIDTASVALEQSIWCGRQIDQLIVDRDDMRKQIETLLDRIAALEARV